MRRTKIVCTIGPASDSASNIAALIAAGMDVARLNFSHGSLDEHANRIAVIREEEEKAGRPIAILLDIQGPKIRIGEVPGGPRIVEKGDRITFTTRPQPTNGAIFVAYPHLTHGLQPGQIVYLDDGLLELRALAVSDTELECEVTVGGELKARKGLTLPGVPVDLPPLGERDLEHIQFGVMHRVDYVAASFVRKGEHVEAVRAAIRSFGGDMPIIAKVESEEGLRNIDSIIKAADGVMVARGDLGIELPPEEVPLVQKNMIARCNLAGIPVITATQMLDSMVRNPRPTRAEVTDVANAILDGTDAVMLSGETAVGKYPAEAVATMHRIAVRTEAGMEFGKLLRNVLSGGRNCIAEAIARATCETSQSVGATAILCSTQSGATARLVSKYRPQAPVIAVTPHAEVARQLPLVWGVYPVLGPHTDNTDRMMDVAITAALKSGMVAVGDVVAVAAGVLTDEPGSTNMLQIHIVEPRD